MTHPLEIALVVLPLLMALIAMAWGAHRWARRRATRQRLQKLLAPYGKASQPDSRHQGQP